MSQTTKDFVSLRERNKEGPDYFGYYAHEIVDLLSQNEDSPPFASEPSYRSRRTKTIEDSYSTSDMSFSNSLGTELSDFQKERLKLLLRHGVKVLAPEVDEILEPVLAMGRLKSQLKERKCLLRGEAFDDDWSQCPPKKRLKRCSLTSSSLPAVSNPNLESNREVDDDLRFLMENNSLQVEEIVKKYSDEYSTALGHMKQQLEKILDTVTSKCRPMTLLEKNKLGEKILRLPRENLDRVMEIIQHRNATYKNSTDEIHVDLEMECNARLWRLYCYVEAVENARILAK